MYYSSKHGSDCLSMRPSNPTSPFGFRTWSTHSRLRRVALNRRRWQKIRATLPREEAPIKPRLSDNTRLFATLKSRSSQSNLSSTVARQVPQEVLSKVIYERARYSTERKTANTPRIDMTAPCITANNDDNDDYVARNDERAPHSSPVGHRYPSIQKKMQPPTINNLVC